VHHNQVYDNTAVYYGAGILISGGSINMVNNTITQNQCTYSTGTTPKGAGIYIFSGSITGRNNIIYGNLAVNQPEIYGTVNFTYSCCSAGLAGTGNITSNPAFIEPAADNFSLMPYSPCIDTGDPNFPLDPDNTRADMGALYFDQLSGSQFAPYFPTNFVVTHNNAALTATLSWVNPTQQGNLQPLTELSGVKIFREGTLITTLTNVVIGQPSTFDDNTVPAAGIWSYEILGYNAHGNGLPVDTSAWIGLDAPGAAQNVIATPDPNELLQCTIAWSAPVDGAHGGYWPAGSFTGQKVYRDNALLATLPGTNTSYLDASVPIAGFYNYAVSYYNDSGEGPHTPATPDPVFVGPPQFEVIPYTWVEINSIGTNTGIGGDDQTLGPFNLPFAFPWYDNQFVSSFKVCSNGWLSFSTTNSTAYTNESVPNSAEPNNAVFMLWDDLNPSITGSGDVYYYNDTANGRFILEFDNVMSYSSPNTPQKFELILYPNGDMDLMYHTVQAPCIGNFTVGIENATGTEGIQVTYNGSGPINPTSGMGLRIHSVSVGNPALDITMTPVGAPLQIPAPGGSFTFDVNLVNGETTAVAFSAWIMQRLPNGTWQGPMLGPLALSLPGGANIARQRIQNVPGTAAPGTYFYCGYVGVYPGVKWDSSGFNYTKLTTGDGPWVDNWENYGDGFEAWMVGGNLPQEFSLEQNYPNPFNPRTTIRYNLAEASRVTLTVYDLQGRRVAELTDGWRSAGTHELTWDASGMASGMYLCRLQAGTHTGIVKMMLVK